MKIQLGFQTGLNLMYPVANNLNGLKMVDGIGLLVGAKVYIKDDPTTRIDSTVVTDRDVIENGEGLHELYFLQTSYREEMDVNPAGTFEYGFYPAFGYFNETSEYPAMSNGQAHGLQMDGHLLVVKQNGLESGMEDLAASIYADMETYFVVNDAQDQEYLELPDRVRYYRERKENWRY